MPAPKASTGELIRAKREELVWGQAELARKAGISVMGLWQIEHGYRNPRPGTVRKIADVLGVAPFDLVASKDPPDPE